MRRVPKTGPKGPFTVYDFAAIGERSATIDRDGQFFMKTATVEGAERMAALLNEAVALASRPDLLIDGAHSNYAATKVAYAVAKAMKRELSWEQAQQAEAAAA